MAITEQIISFTARPVLNNGLDQEGNIKTVNGSFGATLNVSQFNAENDAASTQKLLNIGGALSGVLSKTIYRMTKTVTKSFAES